MKKTAVDLFCGAGGLSRGLVAAGFDVRAAVDNWPRAIESYRANFPGHSHLCGDVAKLEKSSFRQLGVPSELDLVAGGPPCQGFSVQRIGSDFDERNQLIHEFARVVRDLRPKTFLMENVPGLLGKRGRPIAESFIETMAAAGYSVTHRIVDAVSLGVPQVRRRVFFVGYLSSEDGLFSFPQQSTAKAISVSDAISDLISPPADFLPAPGDPLHRRTKMSPKNLQRLALIPPGGGFEDLPVELRVDCHKDGADKIGHRNVYGRLDADKPAVTITARFDSFTRGKFAHPVEDRNITLREGARLQSFPDSHVFLGTQEEIAAQIGNSVPPTIAEAFGRSLLDLIEKLDQSHRKETRVQSAIG
ncbi:DNA cytosine methyltransferase [Rhizobium ruizarguesonis]|uniref:DNA cytosine methyltransferase n=1 Tax=Rhizobium ruizarguesonis TaxID=2081791 RepID=UPI0010304543|nr:DNA cytosine methyltransferase [Rhizobium ruizarguesonis]TBB09813.1 DNA cytosine methyltransferase [Rhizobium ruizarguesonis]